MPINYLGVNEETFITLKQTLSKEKERNTVFYGFLYRNRNNDTIIFKNSLFIEVGF